MHLLTISGFLGSGKTTFIVNLAEKATQIGFRTAILVNEIGEIGIDDQLMRQLDLNVWQLLNGCICCSLATDLPGTLQKLAEEFSPDLVLLEPSGAADLQNVLSTLVYYRGEPLQSQLNIVLLDPLRLEKLMKVLNPLITCQINHANVILINKADVATKDELAYAKEIVEKLKPNATKRCISAKNNLDPAILAELLP